MNGEPRPLARRAWAPDLLLAALPAAAAFALYVRTLAPTVLPGDPGEFQFTAYLAGVAHPTGYPLYNLLGWLWSHLLPFGDAAYRLNLFSAFWAALATGLLYLAARRLLRQSLPSLSPAATRLAAFLAAATLAVTPTFWSQAVIAEVYTLHAFFVVALLYLLLAWHDAPEGRVQGRWLFLAAACFGLSLAHHRTTLVLAPAVLAYLWLARRRLVTGGRHALALAAALLVPLALYLYIPLRAPHSPYLRLPLAAGRELVLYENTLPSFLDFVLGGPFGGSLDLGVDLGARLAMAARLLQSELGWAGLALAAAGVVWLIWRRAWPLLALTGLAFAGTVAFNLVYLIGDVYVLFIPAYIVCALWLALGAGALAHLLSRAAPRSRAAIEVALLVLCLALPLWLAAGHFAELDHSHRVDARSGWQALLAEPLPRQSILVSDDRNDIMPMWYLQYVDGRRPDLLGLFPLITPDYPALGPVLDLATSTGRPVYLIKDMPGLDVKVRAEPEGRLWRVTGPAAAGEPAFQADLRLADAIRLAGYDASPRSPQPGQTLSVSLTWEALGPPEAVYHSFVHLVDGRGQTVAGSDHQPGGVFYPTTLWQPGERLLDQHVLGIPAGTPPGVYGLLIGLYTLGSDGAIRPAGEPVVVGQVGVKSSVHTEPGPLAHPVGARFAGEIELLGYDAAMQNGELVVTLHWRALQPPVENYTVFVHLLDSAGQIVAQDDSLPRAGAYPTSVWDAGEVVTDEHRLKPAGGRLPPGAALRVGLYLSPSGARLPVEGGGDSLDLSPLDLD